MLLIYYTSVAFSLIYLNSVFGFSVKDANGLGNWQWGFNAIAVILIGVISDRSGCASRSWCSAGWWPP